MEQNGKNTVFPELQCEILIKGNVIFFEASAVLSSRASVTWIICQDHQHKAISISKALVL